MKLIPQKTVSSVLKVFHKAIADLKQIEDDAVAKHARYKEQAAVLIDKSNEQVDVASEAQTVREKLELLTAPGLSVSITKGSGNVFTDLGIPTPPGTYDK